MHNCKIVFTYWYDSQIFLLLMFFNLLFLLYSKHLQMYYYSLVSLILQYSKQLARNAQSSLTWTFECGIIAKECLWFESHPVNAILIPTPTCTRSYMLQFYVTISCHITIQANYNFSMYERDGCVHYSDTCFIFSHHACCIQGYPALRLHLVAPYSRHKYHENVQPSATWSAYHHQYTSSKRQHVWHSSTPKCAFHSPHMLIWFHAYFFV